MLYNNNSFSNPVHPVLRLLLLLCILLPLGASASTPEVVVTIQPVHSIVSSIMLGVGEPVLLLEPGKSPHGYTMRPSDARWLSRANLVVWVGNDLETFLEKPLQSLASDAVHLKLMDVPEMQVLPVRGQHHWQLSTHALDENEPPGDPHIWLSVENARQIARAAADTLSGLDPANTSVYLSNLEQHERTLDVLHQWIDTRLRSLAEIPYMVLHDAYQYIESDYGLNLQGVISIRPELGSGIEQVLKLRRRIADSEVRCVFSEPQFSSRIVATVVEGSDARIVDLDPLGVGLNSGSEAYFELMRAFVDTMATCLGDLTSYPDLSH